MRRIFYSGLNNYLKHTHIINPDNKNHTFNTELLDVPVIEFDNIDDIFRHHISGKQTKTVEVLYSGGLDSECVLISCIHNKIPFKAITMRLMVRKCPIDTHDLYYSEKFCREYGIKQELVDLDVDRFFENGYHHSYLDPYKIIEPHVATQFWLLKQCTGFPIMGGDYSWPWTTAPILSPHRYSYCYYDQYMVDHGIFGIGNMMGHSLESNLFFIKNHLNLITGPVAYSTDHTNIPTFKQALLEVLGFGKLTMRLRSYGWENIPQIVIPKGQFQGELYLRHGFTKNSITWGNRVANILGGDIKSNDKFR